MQGYKTGNPIFANITSVYGGSVIVMRLSGELKFIESACVKMGVSTAKLKANYTFLANITHNGKFIDSTIFTYFKAPHSFTGEHVLELSLHGSRFIFNEVCNLLIECGFSFAKNGEFSYRAFLNGKINLVEAEGIASLVASETRLQHEVSVRQFNGETSKTFIEIRGLILEALAYTESLIDFADEEIPEEAESLLYTKLESVKNMLFAFISNGSLLTVQNGIRLAIVGRPNVGKSSIFNKMCGYERAIVSNIAGTTRDTIDEKIIIKGIPIVFYDTAGIRQNTSDEVEEEGVKRALSKLAESDITVVVNTPDSGESFEEITASFGVVSSQNIIYVLNKTEGMEEKENTAIHTNTISEGGIDALMAAIESKIEQNFLPLISHALIATERQKTYLESAFLHLSRVEREDGYELTSESLRLAANCLADIIGKIDAEDVLGSIFSKFCIGK